MRFTKVINVRAGATRVCIYRTAGGDYYLSRWLGDCWSPRTKISAALGRRWFKRSKDKGCQL